jgi:hypothetical protein
MNKKEKRDTRLMGFWLMMERDQSSLMSEDSTRNKHKRAKYEMVSFLPIEAKYARRSKIQYS